MPNCINNLDELKELVATLFDSSDIQFHDFRKHQVMLHVQGTPKSGWSALKKKTDAGLWSVTDNVLWTYKDEAAKIFMGLSRAGRDNVLVVASIASLHKKYLAEVLNAGAVNSPQLTDAE